MSTIILVTGGMGLVGKAIYPGDSCYQDLLVAIFLCTNHSDILCIIVDSENEDQEASQRISIRSFWASAGLKV
jgi:hypothetical protein